MLEALVSLLSSVLAIAAAPHDLSLAVTMTQMQQALCGHIGEQMAPYARKPVTVELRISFGAPPLTIGCRWPSKALKR